MPVSKSNWSKPRGADHTGKNKKSQILVILNKNMFNINEVVNMFTISIASRPLLQIHPCCPSLVLK